jgi:RNA polymerase sigma-70 factor, ECF subfamily
VNIAADTTDEDLARAIADGGGAAESAEAELYRRFAPRVRLYGLRHLRDEEAARDLMQQVMLLTIQKLRDRALRDVDKVGSFILGASRTMAIDLKRRERRRERLRETFMDATSVVHAAVDATLDLDRLEACVAHLTARERAVVLLTFYAERSAGDAGRELGLTAGNVRVIRHRAVDRLRHCMAGGSPS